MSLKDRLRSLADHPLPGFLYVLAHVFLASGRPVPYESEGHYLAAVARAWNPDLLAYDWTFGTNLPDRWTFDHLTGAFAAFLPLEWVGWG